MKKERSPAQLAALAAARARRAVAAPRVAPEGWRSPEHLIEDTREYCAVRSSPTHSELNRLADYLGVSPDTARHWLSRGKQPMQSTLDAIAQWRRIRQAGL